MKNLVVESKYDGKKLTRFLAHTMPNLSINNIYKTLRKRDILINDNRISDNVILHTNDVVTLYITDELLYGKPVEIDVVYEDNNILVINKSIGIPVTDDKNNEISLSQLVKNKYHKSTFIPMPCHRIDRNTSGLVIFAKTFDILEFLLKKFESREISKTYICVVTGILDKKTDLLDAFLFKDSKKSLVYISDTLIKGYLPITTTYKVIKENLEKNISLLEVNIETGRTHQIRAHLAHIGHHILGDGKYGINRTNKDFGVSEQLLCGYKLKFKFKECPTKFEYLNNMEFEINYEHIKKYMD